MFVRVNECIFRGSTSTNLAFSCLLNKNKLLKEKNAPRGAFFSFKSLFLFPFSVDSQGNQIDSSCVREADRKFSL